MRFARPDPTGRLGPDRIVGDRTPGAGTTGTRRSPPTGA
ncbi:hypothetical protein KPATCC21470_8619 [Kitasatospora purpeofusca]